MSSTPQSTASTAPDDTPTGIEKLMQEQFAAQFAFGQPLTTALISAGYATKSLAKAYELLQLPYVQACINANRDWIKSRLAATTDSLLMQLSADRELAHATLNPSAAVAATMAQAKILGLLEPDKQARIPARIIIEWTTPDEAGQQVQVIDAPQSLQ